MDIWLIFLCIVFVGALIILWDLLAPKIYLLYQDKVARYWKELLSYFWFWILVFISFFIFSSFIILTGIQVDIICHGCNKIKDLYILKQSFIPSICLLIIFVMFYKFSYSFKTWVNEVKRTVLENQKSAFKYIINPSFFTKFIICVLVGMLFILASYYWADNSKLPRLDSPSSIEQSQQEKMENSVNLKKKINLAPSNSELNRAIQVEAEANIFRNKWLWIFAFIGVLFTLWGRILSHKQMAQTQEQIGQLRTEFNLTQKKHSVDIHQKAINLLGTNNPFSHIAGCIALEKLAIEDDEMKTVCAHVLFSFINSELENCKITPGKPLPDNIEQAVDSISRIYKKYNHDIMNGEKVILSDIFWTNKKKKPFSIIEANLSGEALSKAHLRDSVLRRSNLKKSILINANFQDADLIGVDFSEANLRQAIFKSADISGAKMETSKNLTVSQIIKADWGYGHDENFGGPPFLPPRLKSNAKISTWLKNPKYDDRGDS